MKKKLGIILIILVILAPFVNAALIPIDLNGESEIRVIEQDSQVFEVNPKIACIDCDKDAITLERSLKIYKVTQDENENYMSMITVSVKNLGNKDIENFEVIEYIPLNVAGRSNEITFTLEPAKIEEASKNIVVTWMFDRLEAGKEASASYVINKKISDEIISQYSPESKIASYRKSQNGKVVLQSKNLKTDNSLLKYIIFGLGSLVGVVFLAYLAIFIFTKRKKAGHRKHKEYEDKYERLKKTKEGLEKMGFKVKDISIVIPEKHEIKTFAERKDTAHKDHMLNSLKEAYK
ncbi:hypothetical protein HYT26_03355 [Candidatus Pacearchaeota archaeon]|nr:hypothetical protein [Candidatus Pacearchaeota archaeon]